MAVENAFYSAQILSLQPNASTKALSLTGRGFCAFAVNAHTDVIRNAERVSVGVRQTRAYRKPLQVYATSAEDGWCHRRWWRGASPLRDRQVKRAFA